MEKREFIIGIAERGFTIIEKSFQGIDLREINDIDWTDEYFAGFFLKDNKVIEISEMQRPRESEITECADDVRLHEDVNFKTYFYGEEKSFHEFDGNFVEALVWLNKTWDEWYP